VKDKGFGAVLLTILGLSTLVNVGCAGFSSSSSTPPPQTYSISGTISPSAGGNAASVTLGGAASATTITDNSGNYSFSGLASGNYTVTPSKSQFRFSPSNQSTTISASNVTGMNFTASQIGSATTYSISGTISPSANGAGVTMTLGGAASASTITDSSGNYTFSGLAGGSYTLTPSESGYSFNPVSQNTTVSSSNVSGVNFTAAENSTTTYSISGTIGPSASGGGVTVALTGASSGTTTTDSSGNYTFSGLGGGSYTLTPSKNGYDFSPPSESETISTANVTDANFTASQNLVGVDIHPGDDIPTIVANNPAGTTFVIYPGTYRLTQPIIAQNGDSFIGQTACAPPASSCPAIISGSTIVGPLAAFNGTNYVVTNQTQQNPTGTTTTNCDPGWLACIYPEDLYFDGTPYQHLYSSTLPTIGPGQWWFDYTNHIIYFHDNPSGHTVETSVIPIAFGGAANNVTIQYLTVQEFASMYPNAAIGVSEGNNPQTQGANWTIQYCEVQLNHGNGIRVGYGIQILNNYSHDNGQVGVGGGLGVVSAPSTESINSGILIQGNLIAHNDYAHFNPMFGSGGIKIGSTSGVTIRGNTIQDNEGSGIHFDDNSQNAFVDGNTITNNSDADGLQMEIGYGTSTFRNNIVSGNGAQVNGSNSSSQIAVRASAGVNAYCNVMEMSSGSGINQWVIGAADRGNSAYPPYQYLATTGNSFHHNTVIWNTAGAGAAGFIQGDAANQPNFFADNTPPNYNTYHMPSIVAANFTYDNNDSQSNTALAFAGYQANGADTHGTADTNYTSGFPTVAITSPADQSSSTGSVAIAATATDPSGISKVELYLDWVLQSSVVSAPYNFTIAGSTGSHVIAAMAYNNAGTRSCYAITLNEQ
jgi:parallel beta-helix repeat protein